MPIARTVTAATALLLLVSSAHAQPALGRPRAAGPLAVVYPDIRDARVFYYPPGPLRIANDRSDETAPDLRFLQLIYTGTSATRDANTIIGRSVLSFRVAAEPIAPTDLASARAALPSNPVLRPLPIERIDSTIVWTPIVPATTESDAPAGAPAPTTLGDARTEESDRAPHADGSWSERIFTINPDPLSSEALWSAFQNGSVMMSVACTWLAKGDDRGETVIAGTPEVADSLRAAVAAEEPHIVTMPVRGDTVSVVADMARHPALFKRIDLSASLPPGYAAIDVRCWDFHDEIRPDLARKTVEVRAHGVRAGAERVVRSVTFRSNAPDVYSASLTFPFAVRLDRPFTWRVVEIARDGTRRAGEWREGDWARQLNVTTQTDQQNPQENQR